MLRNIICISFLIIISSCSSMNRERIANALIGFDQGSHVYAPIQSGIPVYGTNQCIGAIVNGQCYGSIMMPTNIVATCHGQMLNGQCTGPMF